MRTWDYVDLFAGPGGWDVAARDLGLDGVGLENDGPTVETREAAGLGTAWVDVRDNKPGDFPARGLVASPPCQTFSQAGRGAGRRALDHVEALAVRLYAGDRVPRDGFPDERTGLVLEPLRWALEAWRDGTPYQWVALEQVPGVLPAWEVFARVLRTMGYTTATGYLRAEEYGVPQTRRRAFLVASLEGQAVLPAPTHRTYRKGVPQAAGDAALAPWVSMAEALGWAQGLVGFPRRVEAGDRAQWYASGTYEVLELDGVPYRLRDLRPVDHPAQVVTEKARSWLRFPWEVRVRDQTGTDIDLSWPVRRPATVVAGRDLVQHPGSTANRFQPEVTKSRNDGLRVLPEEAAVLQSFPHGHPFQGLRTHVFRQIGNAVPVLLARAVLQAATTQHTQEGATA